MINTTNIYDMDLMLEKYSNFLKSIVKKYSDQKALDADDLFAQAQLQFIELVKEYDSRRGVDFPGYIKIMLPKRFYHYVIKQTETHNKELLQLADKPTLDSDVPDYLYEKELELIEGFASLNRGVVSGKKRNQLVDDILIHRKTIEEIAAEEGVTTKVIRLRLHFLCKRIMEDSQRQILDDFLITNLVRIPIKFFRQAISIQRIPVVCIRTPINLPYM